MSNPQVQSTSYPYMTAACTTLLLMNFIVFPIQYLWKKKFPAFKSLPKQMRRHDTNLLLRTLSGPPIMGVAIYIAVKTFDDLEWWYKNQVFVSYWMLIFLTIDLFDLSQRRKFDWQPYVHHTLQTLYGLYLFDWTTNYYRSFPSIGLVILSSGDRWKFSLFPLRRVVKDKKVISAFAKFVTWGFVLDIASGFAVMLAFIIKYKEHLPLYSMILQPVVYGLFQIIDLPFFVFVYKTAYPNVKSDQESEQPRRRTSIFGPGANMDELVSNEVGQNNTIFGHPYFFDGEDVEDDDYLAPKGRRISNDDRHLPELTDAI